MAAEVIEEEVLGEAEEDGEGGGGEEHDYEQLRSSLRSRYRLSSYILYTPPTEQGGVGC